MSPINLISTLGMLLLGARGLSADVLRDLLQMDKFYTFNPHLVLRNVTQAIQSLKDVHDVTFFSQFLVDKVRGRVSWEGRPAEGSDCVHWVREKEVGNGWMARCRGEWD